MRAPEPPRRGPPRSRVNEGRAAALRALVCVDHGEHPEDALGRLAPADPQDRGLAWHLVLGVLRHRSELDAAICTVAKRATRNIDPEALAALRIGTFELRYSRVPPHAAVDQAVEACRTVGVGHAAGFVNAVLRRQHERPPTPEERLGHPPWLIDRWRGRWGDRADGWMEANNQPAPVYIAANGDSAGVARAFQHAGLVLSPIGPGLLRLPEGAGAIEHLPGYDEGRWWVMDPAAAAVADLVDLKRFPEHPEVLDACAAPGGKSFRLASRGARVFATDVDPVRLERVTEGAERLDLAVWAQPHDWLAGPLPGKDGAPRRFAAVLVDAPCTGLGVLRRHPDIRWRRHPEDVTAASVRQATILRNASLCVADGGVLVYAVCSPEPEEGIAVAVAHAAASGWRIEEVFDNGPEPRIPEGASLSPASERLRQAGGDVFWACRMVRREEPAA